MFDYLQNPKYVLVILIILAGAVISIKTRKLTFYAAGLGALIAIVIFYCTGLTGICMLASFFAIGTGATAWKFEKKTSSKLHEANGGRRRPGQVFANAGAAGILAIFSLFFPESIKLINLMIAATFAASASDTVSSELGNVYGNRFYNILSFKRDSKGLDGVISLEGTLLGIAGAILIATVYSVGFGWTTDFYVIVLAGTFGNFTDSLIGATLERKKLINNDLVNFLNNVAAAGFTLFIKSL